MNWARFFFGALVVAVGAIFLLDAAGVLDAGDVIASWWPVAMIAAGGLSLATNPRHWLVPLVLVAGGGALLLWTTGVVDSLAVIGPVALVVVGLAVIAGIGIGSAPVETDDRVSAFNVFSGSNLASHSDHFEGGSLGALFGGADLDLRDAELAPGAALDVFAAFGGAEIKVPEGWNVVTHGMPIFGGFENVTATEHLEADAPRLDVNATVLFGGIEVKH